MTETLWVKLEDVEDVLIEGISNATVVEKLAQTAMTTSQIRGLQCTGVCQPDERLFSPFCPVHGPGGPEDALKVHVKE